MWVSSTGGSDGLVPQRRWRKAGRMEMRRSVGEVTRAVVGLLLPGRCASCGQPADVLCRPCRHDFSRARLPFPSRATPTPCPAGLPTTITAAPLVEPLRGLVSCKRCSQCIRPFLQWGEILPPTRLVRARCTFSVIWLRLQPAKFIMLTVGTTLWETLGVRLRFLRKRFRILLA